MDPIYLDYNATTPLHPEVIEAMMPYMNEHFGNASSGHIYGMRASQAIGQAREKVAELIGAEASEIVFTSGGTEANNLAICGVMACAATNEELITSIIEHPATLEPCRWLGRNGVRVKWMEVDETGRVSVEQLKETLGETTALISMMHANNETGTIQPVEDVSTLARGYGVLVHTDAAQSVGKIPVNVNQLGVDLLSIAAHKLYGPKGVGALYVRKGVQIEPFVRGAGHERGLRPGTENVAGIVGFAKACEIARAGLEAQSRTMKQLRDALWQGLQQQVPDIALNGHLTLRLPNTLNVSFAGVCGSQVLANAPQIAASTGSACHVSGEKPSLVLTAMGLSKEQALGAVRISVGRQTTLEQVQVAVDALARAYRRAVQALGKS